MISLLFRMVQSLLAFGVHPTYFGISLVYWCRDDSAYICFKHSIVMECILGTFTAFFYIASLS